MEPSKRSSVDGQKCTWLDKNPLTASRVGLISFNDDDDDERITILRTMKMMLIAMTKRSIAKV